MNMPPPSSVPPASSGPASSGPASSDPATWAKNFAEYWPLYLSQHGDRRTRRWHYLGTLAGMGAGLFVLGYEYARGSLFEAVLLGVFTALVISYGLVLLSHWVIEGNPPAASQNSGKERMQILKELSWSLRADWKLLWLALNESVAEECERNNLNYRR